MSHLPSGHNLQKVCTQQKQQYFDPGMRQLRTLEKQRRGPKREQQACTASVSQLVPGTGRRIRSNQSGNSAAQTVISLTGSRASVLCSQTWPPYKRDALYWTGGDCFNSATLTRKVGGYRSVRVRLGFSEDLLINTPRVRANREKSPAGPGYFEIYFCLGIGMLYDQ